MESPAAGLEALLRIAIQARRRVEFRLYDALRVGDPHLLGTHAGALQLLFYQVRGESRSGSLPNWRRAPLARITALRVLDESFDVQQSFRDAGPKGWDEILLQAS